jgi:excinuclease ABC subunit A
MGQPPKSIRLCGAKTHNLKGMDVEFPHGSMTVVTGVSGSGKSSLVFDTLHAEGQRQYLNTIAAANRQWIDALPRPPIDSILGLQPTLCIDQATSVASHRSTVGTLSEIYDFLRLLMARAGVPYCHQCGQPIQQQAASQIVDDLQKLPVGTKLTLLAPIVRGRKGNHSQAFETIRKVGLVKVRVDGQLLELEDSPILDSRKEHSIDAVCDRIVVREDSKPRLEAAVQLAIQLAEGAVAAAWRIEDSQEAERLFSTRFNCLNCGLAYAEIEPRMFSYHSPYGACPSCNGEGMVKPVMDATTSRAKTRKPSPVTQIAETPNESDKGSEESIGASPDQKEESGQTVCPDCQGTRLRPESRAIRWRNASIDQMTAWPLAKTLGWFEESADEGSHQLGLSTVVQQVESALLPEIVRRLTFLDRVGLGYLSLDRPTQTLSGGELQRVRLATSLGTGLIGVCYILDEPSIGLHPRDGRKLLEVLHELRDAGNTLIVVEHDEQIMLGADRIIDIGPGAGQLGGEVLAAGTVDEVIANASSMTGSWLRPARSNIELAKTRRTNDVNRAIVIQQADRHNLKSIDVSIPLACFVAVSGVSGSGKSSLILETLVPALRQFLAKSPEVKLDGCQRINGLEQIDKLVVVDQTAIGRSPRSTPATYTGLWDLIREVLAQTRDAKQRGFSASRFSFNSGAGRCEACQGQGFRRIDMGFLGESYATCPNCHGTRFNPPTLAVKYRERNVADILSSTIDEAADFFQNFAKVAAILHALQSVGLGYLQLGQASQSLSGGEAQRVKLATELSKPSTSRTLYILDEPTSGLHFQDVQQLLTALQSLVDAGNSVIVIEHHLDVIEAADWVIDLGPEAGPLGGYLVASGPPATIAACPTSITGSFLKNRIR